MIYLTRVKKDLPQRGEGIRLAIYQGEGSVGTSEAVQCNIKKLEEVVKQAKKYDVQLISFPELYMTGYALNSELVKQLAEEINGPSAKKVSEIAKDNNMAIIFPYPEKDSSLGNVHYYDSIAFINFDGSLLQNYRKTHLFGQAEKENFSSGYTETVNENLFSVVRIDDFPVGILNCYEAEFPELSRILALKGAKLIVIPTAADYYYTLSDGTLAKVPYPDVTKNIIPSNAYFNKIFIAYSNRCGYETVGKNSWQYRGNSIISSPNGDLLLAARPEETLLIADIIPSDFGPTHPEGDYLKDRRPELYHELIAKHAAFDGGYDYPDKPA
jgi:predicted amidohydrolase